MFHLHGRTRVAAALLAATAAAAAAAPLAATLRVGQTGAGEGTYFVPSTRGNCALAPLPAQYDGLIGVAVSTADYAGSVACGACLRVTGSGDGAGADPITGPLTAYVMDRCTDCAAGDVDLASPGDGRWAVSWTVVPCPTAGGAPEFVLDGSNPHYLKVQVRGLPAPAATVSVGGVAGARTQDNFFIVEPAGAPLEPPLTVTGTTVEGGAFEGSIPRIENEVVLRGGSVSEGGTGGGGEGGAPTLPAGPPPPPSPPSPPPSGTRATPAPAQAPPPPACAPVYGQCGGRQHRGPTCCEAGTCEASSEWYAQCRP